MFCHQTEFLHVSGSQRWHKLLWMQFLCAFAGVPVWHKCYLAQRGPCCSSVFMWCAVNASKLIQDLITHNSSHLNLLSEGFLIEHWQMSSKQMGPGNPASCVFCVYVCPQVCERNECCCCSPHGSWQAFCRGSV